MERVWRLRGWLVVLCVWAVVAVGCRCDGGPPTESSAEGVGEERDGDSGVSKEGIEGVIEGANESPADGVVGEPRACTHPCDCRQGEGCEGGICRQGAVAVYCCDKAGCVVGEVCLSPRTGSGKCGEAGRVCKSVCDCAVGLSCEGGQCSALGQKVACCSRPEECKQGACQRSDGSLGVCGEKPACQKTCDCPQGEACVQGRCVGGSRLCIVVRRRVALRERLAKRPMIRMESVYKRLLVSKIAIAASRGVSKARKDAPKSWLVASMQSAMSNAPPKKADATRTQESVLRGLLVKKIRTARAALVSRLGSCAKSPMGGASGAFV